MRTLIHNIHKLYYRLDHPTKAIVGAEMDEIDYIENAYLIIENDLILDFGLIDDLPESNYDRIINAQDSLVLPTWVDSHTHLVYAKAREEEFVQRIRGLSYEEIARRGGGILNSAEKLRAIDENQLYEESQERLNKLIQLGTGAIEIKSGYGLNLEAELKMLRVIRRLKENNDIAVKASFLAAHAYPLEYKENKKAYVQLIIEEMLPRVAHEGLADYMDVFCEEGFFSVADTELLLEASWKYGLKPKIHANQLHYSGGVQVGVKHHALSVDHLECVGTAEIEALKNSTTMPTLLPAAAFFLGISYQPARALIDAGLPVVIASDYNPGSCPSGNMNLLASIACTQLKMTPNEVFHAMTLNAALSIELAQQYGSITRGKKANLMITHKMDNLDYLPYDFGNNPIKQVFINGKAL